MHFLKSHAQEHNLQCQTISKNMLQGWTFKTFKTSGNCGYLIKRPSGRQCVKELFIYWCNFVAENFEPLRTLTGVKNWTHWHSLTSAKWTFFYFAVKLYPLLYSECSETRLIWIFLLLWNLKTGMLLFPAAEHQYPLSAAKLDQLEYFKGCVTRVIGILRLLWRFTHSYNSIPCETWRT